MLSAVSAPIDCWSVLKSKWDETFLQKNCFDMRTRRVVRHGRSVRLLRESLLAHCCASHGAYFGPSILHLRHLWELKHLSVVQHQEEFYKQVPYPSPSMRPLTGFFGSCNPFLVHWSIPRYTYSTVNLSYNSAYWWADLIEPENRFANWDSILSDVLEILVESWMIILIMLWLSSKMHPENRRRSSLSNSQVSSSVVSQYISVPRMKFGNDKYFVFRVAWVSTALQQIPWVKGPNKL